MISRKIVTASVIFLSELGCLINDPIEGNNITEGMLSAGQSTESLNTGTSTNPTGGADSNTGTLTDGVDPESETESTTATEEAGHIQFAHLAVGQRSRYQHFHGLNYGDLEKSSFTYDNVILNVEVVEETPEGFLVVESFEPGHEPTSDTRGLSRWIEPENMRFLLQVDGDRLLAKPVAVGMYSYLFEAFYVGERPVEDELPLAPIEGPEVKIVNWQSDLGYCECYRSGFLPFFDLLGARYTSLNVVQNDVGMQVDGPGFTHVYSRNNGILRRTWADWWDLEGGGWDRIPQ